MRRRRQLLARRRELLLRRSTGQRDRAAAHFDDLGSGCRRADERIAAIRRVAMHPLTVVYGTAALLFLYQRLPHPRLSTRGLSRAAALLGTGWQVGWALGLLPKRLDGLGHRTDPSGEKPD